MYFQINLRLFRDGLFTTVFSSQSRCVAPTKTYTGSTGYGCFAYVPLLWYEDGLVIDPNKFDFDFVHFYSRPGTTYSTYSQYLANNSTSLNYTVRHLFRTSCDARKDRYSDHCTVRYGWRGYLLSRA